MSSLATTSSVYTQGDLVLQYPIEASTTFLFVVVFSAVLEFGIDFAADVENKYFRVMFDAINQEVMIVGLLVLAVAFAQTLYDFPDVWVLIFQWAMMVLFFMALLFVGLIMTVLGVVSVTTKQWSHFEVETMDSGQPLSGRELQYKMAFNKFQQALQAFGYDSSQGIRFSEYLAKLKRRNIVAMTDLTWVCWVCLATLVILNTLRSEATKQASQAGDQNIEDAMSVRQRLINYGSFIFFIGYGILTVYIVAVHLVLSRRLDELLTKKRRSDDAAIATIGATADGIITRDDLEDSKGLLFRRSTEATLEVIQVLILGLEWFTATFFLSFSNEMVTNLGWGVAAPVFIAAIIPLVVFSIVLPWTLTVVTMLSSLGTNLDEDVVRYLIIKAGIPMAEWPPHMREAFLRQQDREKDRNDVRSVRSGGSQRGDAMSSVGNFSFAKGLSFAAPPALTSVATGSRPLPLDSDYRADERSIRDDNNGTGRAAMPRGIGSTYRAAPAPRDGAAATSARADKFLQV